MSGFRIEEHLLLGFQAPTVLMCLWVVLGRGHGSAIFGSDVSSVVMPKVK